MNVWINGEVIQFPRRISTPSTMLCSRRVLEPMRTVDEAAGSLSKAAFRICERNGPQHTKVSRLQASFRSNISEPAFFGSHVTKMTPCSSRKQEHFLIGLSPVSQRTFEAKPSQCWVIQPAMAPITQLKYISFRRKWTWIRSGPQAL